MEADPQRPNALEFQSADGAMYTTSDPLTADALRHLSEISPQSRGFASLLTEARLSDKGAQTLSANLLQAFSCSAQLVELQTFAPVFSLEVSEYPLASPLARLQARRSSIVSNLRHEQIILDDLHTRLLPLLDGQHPRELTGRSPQS